MSIRLASNSIRIRRQAFMGFKSSCSIGILAVLGTVFAGGAQSYAGVAYAHVAPADVQATANVQNTPADLPKLDLAADPASTWLSHQSDNKLSTVGDAAQASTTDVPSTQWLAKWDSGTTEPAAVSNGLRSSKPASVDQDSESTQVRPLAIPTPSAWSAGMAGLLGLGFIRFVYRARTARRNYR